MQADIYDFDKTIVPFDSETKFFFFCLKRYPWLLLYLPVMGIAWVLMELKIISFDKCKSTFTMFWAFVPHNGTIKKFWDSHEKYVNAWFKDKPRHAIVISASPDYLLNEIKDRIGIDTLICTKHDAKTGKMLTKNCRDDEKVKRLYEQFDKNTLEIIDVYSDSLKHDKPIFSLATNNCYHIVNKEKIPFKFNDKF